jgi:hypothetical protein
VATLEALAGKTAVGLYFSAHWCGALPRGYGRGGSVPHRFRGVAHGSLLTALGR